MNIEGSQLRLRQLVPDDAEVLFAVPASRSISFSGW